MEKKKLDKIEKIERMDKVLENHALQLEELRTQLVYLEEKFFEHQHSPAGVLTQVMERP